MSKITGYYLNQASYIAVDENGKKYAVTIDYWNGGYKISRPHPQLEDYAAHLVKKKHRVNYVAKMHEPR